MHIDEPPIITLPLWDRTRAMFARALAAIGAPAAIAALTLTPAVRRQIVGWIALLEHIVRKLLLADAIGIETEPSSFRTREARSGTQGMTECNAVASGFRVRRCATPRNDESGEPSTWRTRFALSPPRDPLQVADTHAPRIRSLWDDAPSAAPKTVREKKPALESDSALRLARRLEAVRRVLENPQPHARRLARLLTRLHRRFPEIATRYAIAPARTVHYDRDDQRLSIDAMGVALNGSYAFRKESG